MLKIEVCLDWLDLVDLESHILSFSFSSLCEREATAEYQQSLCICSDQGTDAARLGKSVKMIRFLKVSLLTDRRDRSLN